MGQILIVTAGTGRVQQWGGSIKEIRQGDVVRIPPDIKHWHGVSPNTLMTHIAIQEALNGKAVDWMEHARYSASVRAVGANPSARAMSSVQPTAAQRAQPTADQRVIGDIALKLVELTDNVLFGDVWTS
ncbi:cupin domain-containing protein [Phormidium sp. FACHB-592]|uniref:Cupin domain-containing protein n=1 Tax=Stenomitos frigidus AS-A4 TaxID=2933935 RepID=A0ABV0KPF9_9CYAN|nr:cupin domain-containing protein [Phormidium sp. FACHB-592]MBD2074955.1 cupin domain-containing protein [Phormidium sp. FACHB-592]